jgi:hypothetical protein
MIFGHNLVLKVLFLFQSVHCLPRYLEPVDLERDIKGIEETGESVGAHQACPEACGLEVQLKS